MYEKVSPNLNFVEREKNVENFWKENHIFEKSMENRKDGETYTLAQVDSLLQGFMKGKVR